MFLPILLVLAAYGSAFAPLPHPADAWAVTRKSTAEEQKEVDKYRKGDASYSFRIDFHDGAAARAAFEPVTDDLAWLKSCRQPENVVINGALRLQTREAKNCKTKWSGGYVITKDFHQLYGYFEGRMKITKKAGINNAFWLTGTHLEIDVVEARYPNIIHWTVHDWGTPRRAKRCEYTADHLDDRMNDYGVLWLPDRLIYAFNGKAVCTIETKYPAVPVEIRFSTAIADFEGHTYENGEDPTGTEMDVAWVHVTPLLKQ
jgi:beta-glucanase (GH16 family)